MARRGRDWWWSAQDLGEALAYNEVSEAKAKGVIEVVALSKYSRPKAKRWRELWYNAAMRHYNSAIRARNS